MLQAKNIIRTASDGYEILKGASMAVKAGEITALIGPSGGGKTTMLRAMAMLDLPDGGEILLDDISYKFPLAKGTSIEPTPWPQVTAVFQQLFLWPHLTLRENIMLPLKQRLKTQSSELTAHLELLIEQFDMTHFIDRYPNETSGGQRQRAALARALILNPKYVLLDEITSALDVEQTAKVLDALMLLKQRGIGVLLITHLLNFARKTADNVVFLAEGKVVEQGAAKILANPQTKRLKLFMKSVEMAS